MQNYENIRKNIWDMFYMPATLIWDIENINMPKDLTVADVKRELSNLAKTHNADIKESVVIGSAGQFRDSLRLELLKNDFVFKNITSGKKNAADMRIIYYIMKLKENKPPPYKIILITGDADFTDWITLLIESSYEVILIHLNNSRKELIDSASYSISWNDLIKPLIKENDLFTKTRTISDSSEVSSSMDTISELTHDINICIVKFYTSNLHDYYSIPVDIKVNVGDIVKVGDSIGSMNSWNIGKIVKILDYPTFDKQEHSVKNVISDEYFDKLLNDKLALDKDILDICNEFHEDIFAAELRWDRQSITLYHKGNQTTDFTELKYQLKKTYDVYVFVKYIMICTKQKCINRYCNFYHNKV